MCEIPSGLEQELFVPSSVMELRSGFAIDCGCSAMKFVYITREEQGARLHFYTYPRERIDEGLDRLSDKVKDNLDKKLTYFTTGIGGNQFQADIEKTIGVTTKNMLELDCSGKGFNFIIKNFPLSDLVYPPSEVVTKYSSAIAQEMTEMLKSWQESGSLEESSAPDMKMEEAPKSDISPQFPLTVIQIGSGGGAMKLHEDGKMDILDTIPLAGRFFRGMGSLLTGAKSYEELITLAEKGDASKVDVLANQLSLTANDEYSKMDTAMKLFPFGHCVDKNIDDFKREDLAAALLSLLAQDVAGYAHHLATIENTKAVFFAGGVCSNSQLTRDEIGKHFQLRGLMSRHSCKPAHHFLKLGSYFGAVGALLKTIEDQ